MASDASLVATLGANLDQFGNDMKKADELAEKSVKSIEDQFAKANPSMKPGLDKMAAEAVSHAGDIGAIIGTALGTGLVVAATLAIEKFNDLITTLAKIGDRSDDLRLPVNLMQALSVAGEKARVSTNELNKALDTFTRVSKDDEPKKFNKALENIDASFVRLFKNAGTQEERLRLVADAFSKATTEVQRAQLAQEVFGTDSERLISIFASGRAGIDGYIEQIKRLGLEINEAAVVRAQEARSNLNLLSRVLNDEFSSALAGLIPTFVSLLPYLERFGAIIRDTLALFSTMSDRPTATLQNNIAAVEEQIKELEDANKKLTETRETTANLLDPLATLNGIDFEKMRFKNADEVLAENQEKINFLKAQLRELRDALDLSTREVTLPEIKVGGGAFKGRPSLSDSGSDSKDAFERQIDTINKHIATMEADAEAVGKTAAEHEKLRVEAQLTEALLRSGIEINDEYAAKMDAIAKAAAKAAGDLDAAKTKFQGINDALKFSGNQLVDVLDRAMQKGAKFGDIMADVLRNVQKQLLQAAITGEGAFGKILGLNSSVAGGTGGILGALFKGFFPAKAAEGTMNSPGGMTLVGERGPELVNLPRGAQVFPNDVTKQIMSGPTGVTIAMSNDFRGVDPASVNRIEAKLNEMQRTLPSQVASIVPDLRRRSARGF